MWFPWIRTRVSRSHSSRHPRERRATVRPRVEALEDRSLPSTFTVSSLADTGAGTLRQAIFDANAHAGPDTIRFTTAGTIALATALPALTDTTGGTTIDGSTAPGFAGAPVITLHGPGTASGLRGLLIQSTNNTMRALQIDSFDIGIQIAGAAASNNVVSGCYLGTDGSTAIPNIVGLWIDGAPNNRVGTNADGVNDAGERNVISGNTLDGIEVFDSASGGNRIMGNFIGTDATGTRALGNGNNGVIVNGGAHDNFVGTDGDGGGDASESNVISANFTGVVISDTGSTGNVVAGNRVGTDAGGTVALGNTDRGVRVTGGATRNRVGTNADGVSDDLERNVISGNGTFGVGLDQATTTDNVVAGNFIGTDASGLVALGNGGGGVVISVGASDNTIGGTSAGARNVISANLGGPVFGHGVEISDAGTHGNVVLGNFIGTDKNGSRALPNTGDGVFLLTSADGNTVGGTASGARNLIAGNLGDGIGVSTDNNRILGNSIGGNSLLRLLGNGGNGVFVAGSGNVVGGTGTGAANTIAFNRGAGVLVTSGAGNAVRGNSIHDNARLGINLVAASDAQPGVTLNDTGDADAGPNNLQNFPVLQSAVSSSGGTTIQGTLSSTPSSTFTLDLYASAAADPSGFGEGATFLGSVLVRTNLLGTATFTASFTAVVPAGQVVTATATGPGGNTSEFSEALGVANGVSVSVGDAAVFEGTGGTVTADFTVSLSGPTSVPVTVQYATTDNTAIAPDDYQAVAGSLTFNPGDPTSQKIHVSIVTDSLDEPDETYFVQLSNAVNATISDGLGIGTIVDDDAPPSVSISDAPPVTEGNTGTVNATFTATLSAPSGQVVTVAYASADGTAVAPGDYQAVSGSLVFTPGQTSQTVTVPVNGDLLGEANETFTVNLSNPSDATIVDGQGVDVILNDDPTPAFQNRSVTPLVTEGSVATLRGTIAMPNTTDTFTLEVSWGDGTPVETLTFPAGSNGQMVTLDHVYADNPGEPAGTYAVHVAWHNQFGGGNFDDFSVVVQNAPPVVDAGPDGTTNPGGVLNRSGSFTDPGADTWTATVDYGDGTGPQVLKLDKDGTFKLHHKYDTPGTFRVIVTVTDDDGGVGTASFEVTVDDG
jgi:hypothetical protein